MLSDIAVRILSVLLECSGPSAALSLCSAQLLDSWQQAVYKQSRFEPGASLAKDMREEVRIHSACRILHMTPCFAWKVSEEESFGIRGLVLGTSPVHGHRDQPGWL